MAIPKRPQPSCKHCQLTDNYNLHCKKYRLVMSVLTKEESEYLKSKFRRNPNKVETEIVSAEWSEHCSYKSSKRFIRTLPTKGNRIILGPGNDAGVLDVGDGYVVTVHIESHNHPSAVDPYGGAATGVGGVIRDILSMGSRPIALLNALRFAPPQYQPADRSSPYSKWLLRNVVRGIGDYGNCIGVPTVAGEMEFDRSFGNYCLVDVASLGFCRRESIVQNTAKQGDCLIIVGGPTGRDGIRGASFASTVYVRDDRSAVQIPDPFLEKLIIEATLEVLQEGAISALKDLGGGGLACCLSEVSDNLGKGFVVDLADLHVKEKGMSAEEIMLSESQERMLIIADNSKVDSIKRIFEKYELKYAIIGNVAAHSNLVIKHGGRIVANIPARIVANAPQASRHSKRPPYLSRLSGLSKLPTSTDLTKTLLTMLSNPTCSSKEWAYRQYDHEVGARTVLRPGEADAAVLRLTDRKFISIKLDGNSKHCYIDPYHGTLGCLSEACRNVVCTGADPIGIIDHLQFGSPENPEVFWTFKRAVSAIRNFCKFMKIPVVGGKVSFYNETPNGPIKPSPIIGAIGLIEEKRLIQRPSLKEGDAIFIIGTTKDEIGGSEYLECIHHITGGNVPKLDLVVDKLNRRSVLHLIENNAVSSVHDCSKGGIATALCEMAVLGHVGFTVFIDNIPNSCSCVANLLFSESHSRYLIGTQEPEKVQRILSNVKGLVFFQIGSAHNEKVVFKTKNEILIDTNLRKLTRKFGGLEHIMAS
jgi:phosphoribosylformylglycinamidine synthase subunit PurL